MYTPGRCRIAHVSASRPSLTVLHLWILQYGYQRNVQEIGIGDGIDVKAGIAIAVVAVLLPTLLAEHAGRLSRLDRFLCWVAAIFLTLAATTAIRALWPRRYHFSENKPERYWALMEEFQVDGRSADEATVLLAKEITERAADAIHVNETLNQNKQRWLSGSLRLLCVAGVATIWLLLRAWAG